MNNIEYNKIKTKFLNLQEEIDSLYCELQDIVEMICDWIGAGMVYSGEDWTQAEPLNYYNKVRAGRHFHPETEELIIKLLEIIRDKGLEEFHRICKQRYPLLTDYDSLYIP